MARLRMAISKETNDFLEKKKGCYTKSITKSKTLDAIIKRFKELENENKDLKFNLCKFT